jgi:acyl carrier protein
MNDMGLRTKLKEIIIDVTHSSDEVEDIEDCDFLVDDLGVDSLGMINLVAILEREFNIKIPNSEVTLKNFKSVELLSGYIGSKITG